MTLTNQEQYDDADPETNHDQRRRIASDTDGDDHGVISSIRTGWTNRFRSRRAARGSLASLNEFGTN